MGKDNAGDDPHANLDEGMRGFLEMLAEATPPGTENLPLAQQRAAWNGLCLSLNAPHPPGLSVTNITCNGMPCRFFRPAGNRILPAIIYAHGGGFVMGSPDTHDDICAEISALAEVGVLLMDYRLAPEHPFPAQLEDSLKVWRWLRESGHRHNLDPDRVVAAGDSAGGQMSAALVLVLQELNLPQVQGAVLIYPGLGSDTETESYRRNAHAPGLSRQDMMFYLRSFLGPQGSPAWHNPKAVPNLAADVSCFPPTFVTVASHDPVRDDGVIFYQKLQAAGVAVALREEPYLAHSYIRARHHSKTAKEGFDAIVKALRSLAWEGVLPA